MARPKWGARRVVLNDLSPAATFIAANYNLPFDVDEFARAGKQILDEVEQEIGWMYETLHTDGKTKGPHRIHRLERGVLLSRLRGEVVFLDEALDEETKRVKDAFPCPHCGIESDQGQLAAGLRDAVRSGERQAVETGQVPTFADFIHSRRRSATRSSPTLMTWRF